ncbi:P-loop containing nucleoside triphosphate hydrolase protein [Gymnopus androsaceus JB14]|uniref:RNA helicase n=1 Tax=Gymnopus androsaceus JB14 TaxID=1447944 RepID=A0A6A4HHC3_9AGAR|nr:P-loop containing nucleoside triphosphate hydrolase protein [Gymnopus androsaceus JB14]
MGLSISTASSPDCGTENELPGHHKVQKESEDTRVNDDDKITHVWNVFLDMGFNLERDDREDDPATEEPAIDKDEDDLLEEEAVDCHRNLLPNWHHYNLHPRLTKSLHHNKFLSPTPIQSSAIPIALKQRDVVGVAQTVSSQLYSVINCNKNSQGSGKTLAYGLPILHKLLSVAPLKPSSEHRPVQALILAPTCELALQVSTYLCLFSSHIRSETTKYRTIFHAFYVHRNGRTARVMRKGFSMLMCAPDERRVVRALLGTLGHEISIDLGMLDKLKARVQLARQIETSHHQAKKAKHERNWMRETAEAMEIELDSDFASDDDDENPTKRQRKAKEAKAAGLKAQLKQMLAQLLIAWDNEMLGVGNNDAGSDLVQVRKRKKVKVKVKNERLKEAAKDKDEEEEEEEEEEWAGVDDS